MPESKDGHLRVISALGSNEIRNCLQTNPNPNKKPKFKIFVSNSNFENFFSYLLMVLLTNNWMRKNVMRYILD